MNTLLTKGSVVYEVTSTVSKADSEAFYNSLVKHADHMLKLGHFFMREIHVLTNLGDEGAPDSVSYVVHYRAKSKDNVEEYLKKDSAKMREEITAEWGGKVVYSRRLLTLLDSERASSSSSSLGYIH